MDRLKRIIVSHRSKHHAKHSGYGTFIQYVPNLVEITGKPSGSYTLTKWLAKCRDQNAGLFDTNSLYKERELVSFLKNLNDPAIVHYLNAERDIRTAVAKTYRDPIRFLGTFHKPPEILKERIGNPRFLKMLDGAICVGDNQVDFVKEWLQLDHVEYIPHGIDTQFFKPASEKPKNTQRILFVGQHLRDFDSFNSVIEVLLERAPSLRVDVVVHPAYREKFIKSTRLMIHSNVSDDDLRNLYQESSLLFLPLLEATACNSLLEAMACGLPIVTTDVGGVKGYLEGSGNIMCPVGATEAYVEMVSTLLEDPEKRFLITEKSRSHALSFDWRLIAEKIDNFYKKLAKV